MRGSCDFICILWCQGWTVLLGTSKVNLVKLAQLHTTTGFWCWNLPREKLPLIVSRFPYTESGFWWTNFVVLFDSRKVFLVLHASSLKSTKLWHVVGLGCKWTLHVFLIYAWQAHELLVDRSESVVLMTGFVPADASLFCIVFYRCLFIDFICIHLLTCRGQVYSEFLIFYVILTLLPIETNLSSLWLYVDLIWWQKVTWWLARHFDLHILVNRWWVLWKGSPQFTILLPATVDAANATIFIEVPNTYPIGVLKIALELLELILDWARLVRSISSSTLPYHATSSLLRFRSYLSRAPHK